LVRDVQDLISKYGRENITHVMEFLGTITETTYKVNDNAGNTYTLTASQYARLDNEWSKGNKITAIKIFREMFGNGLKDAKDAVENLFSK
jgi:ribosomal protein L7/L12